MPKIDSEMSAVEVLTHGFGGGGGDSQAVMVLSAMHVCACAQVVAHCVLSVPLTLTRSPTPKPPRLANSKVPPESA